ncbi:hypothetical protein CDD83_5806 [Cordyceps sp. RAO-2017]|nr:hypothetical protein CDD83_5806 [Cordyceps sp. RAO-2017]
MPMYTPITSSDSDEDSRAMKLVYFSNEFPKDDLRDLFRRLHNRSKARRHPLLAQFLSEATWAAKDEVRRLPAGLKQLVPPFQTVLSWAEDAEFRQGPLCGAVDGVLLVVAQLATYIGYAEHSAGELDDFSNTCLAGLGIGLLASTAVALSKTTAGLPLAGADAVRLAFRLGVHVKNVSENLETGEASERPDTWAYVVHDADLDTVRKELDALHKRSAAPDTAKVFVSAVSRTSVTVSGPPARLKALLARSDLFRASRSAALPVYGGLCHAPHVYGPQDTRWVVHGGGLGVLGEEHRLVALPVYSTSTGLPYTATDAAGLLEAVVSELLTEPICWNRVVRSVVDRAEHAAAAEAVLYCFGNSAPLNDVSAGLAGRMPRLSVSVRSLIPWLQQAPAAASSAPRGPAQSKLAIVGMACRLPGGADTTDRFWEVLDKGLDVSRRVPSDRFDVDSHYDASGRQLNKSMTQYGCFIDAPGLFDAPFFNMSPREAQVVDPQMRLALVTAYEALERAGFVGDRTAASRLQRVGTFYGQAADDYREVNQGQEVSTYYIPGGCRAFGPGRINYFFKFAGPSYSIDTACSSGLAAIEVACQALWSGEVDTAVAGGVNILTNPDGFAGLCQGHFLTHGHNACKTWDATADGYCRADGIGSVVLKRLEDAEADNDRILGLILGAGTNHSAEAVSITHPHAGHQGQLSRQVLRQAGVDPLDVSYVELHGTGTKAGDREEMQGILDVYAPLAGRRHKDRPLHIGAVKANVGHGESVAGTTALIKVLLMLQNSAIPPHVGIKTEINPGFPRDFDRRNLHIPLDVTPWPRVPGRPRLAAVNNFGAAGGNTTMVLEEAPALLAAEIADPRPIHAVAVSAKTRRSLAANVERLIAHLDAYPDVSMADLSYTTTARRLHHAYRVAVAASDVTQLRKQLAIRLGGLDSVGPIGKSGPPPVAFAFTGQGASHKSMSLELYRDVPAFREHLVHLDSLARGQGFPSFLPALDGSQPRDHAHPPVVAQLALVCAEMALAKHWSSLGVRPDIVVGHSLGEYAAMHAAGVIMANDAISMVGRRAQLLSERCSAGSHVMMAVRASLAQIAESAGGRTYTIACVNGPSDTVLSGTTAQMDGLTAPLEAAGYRCFKLDVAFAFHSEQMDPILEDFEAAAKAGVVFQEPRLPFISPLLGKVVFDGKTLNAGYVRRATRDAVDFLAAVQSARKMSAIGDETVWVEIGPHPVCTGFVKSAIPSTGLVVPSLRRGEDSWKTMAEAMAALHLAGIAVGWDEFHRPMESKLRLLDLPTYAWNDKNYWLQYNGDWCLTKGNTFYGAQKEATGTREALLAGGNAICTSTVQQIVDEALDGYAGTVAMQSDLMQPDFLAAAHGHRMNNCGVVTSSIHADIAYTLGDYLHRKLRPEAGGADMNIANLVVTKGLVAQSNDRTPQVIRVTAATADIRSGLVDLTWQNVDGDGKAHEPFATASVLYGDASDWLSSWVPLAHLVRGRIEALEQLAAEGKASRFSQGMAYTLFAGNLVDYAEKYRGMQSVVLHQLEGFADVQLAGEGGGGVWTVPPHFIDSVAHLAGFIMNCSDAVDTKNNYCVTPGWSSMRFAKPLEPGARYRSYVKMIPTAEDPAVYLGDVYVLQGDTIVGLVGGIRFRRYPRILLARFFSPPDKMAAMEAGPSAGPAPNPAPKAKSAVPGPTGRDSPNGATPTDHVPSSARGGKGAVGAASAQLATGPDSTTAKAFALIAREAGLEVSDLEDDACFSNLGIDSLLSLVIAEKFRVELDVKVGGSLFLDYPTIGDLRRWLDEYYS